MRTIAHLSDIHFGKTDPKLVEGVVADLSARKPSLVVISGDFTQRARAWQYRQAAEFMRRLHSPQQVVPGNHDIPLFNVFDRFLSPLRNYHAHLTRDLSPVFQDEEMIVMGINTARSFSITVNGFWKDGRISREQLRELERRMCPAPENLFKVLVTHHPFIPPPNARIHGVVLGAGRALAEMERCGVDLLLAGHLHMAYSADVRTHHEEVARSMLSVQAGTATSTRLRGEPNAYNFITIEPNHVEVEVRQWSGKAFHSGATTHFQREEGTWREVPVGAQEAQS
jgi:3',5'-cyclic AMP phosphodiesterase CpdA